jgi:hypothetical protein
MKKFKFEIKIIKINGINENQLKKEEKMMIRVRFGNSIKDFVKYFKLKKENEIDLNKTNNIEKLNKEIIFYFETKSEKEIEKAELIIEKEVFFYKINKRVKNQPTI